MNGLYSLEGNSPLSEQFAQLMICHLHLYWQSRPTPRFQNLFVYFVQSNKLFSSHLFAKDLDIQQAALSLSGPFHAFLSLGNIVLTSHFPCGSLHFRRGYRFLEGVVSPGPRDFVFVTSSQRHTWWFICRLRRIWPPARIVSDFRHWLMQIHSAIFLTDSSVVAVLKSDVIKSLNLMG